jgi:hypothetical protein
MHLESFHTQSMISFKYSLYVKGRLGQQILFRDVYSGSKTLKRMLIQNSRRQFLMQQGGEFLSGRDTEGFLTIIF